MKQAEKEWAKKLRDLEKKVKMREVAPDLFGRRRATPEEVKRVITRPQEGEKNDRAQT